MFFIYNIGHIDNQQELGQDGLALAVRKPFPRRTGKWWHRLPGGCASSGGLRPQQDKTLSGLV